MRNKIRGIAKPVAAKISNKVRRLNSLKLWSAITGVALVVALVLTFLPMQVSVNTGGLLSISLNQVGANPGWLSGYDYRKVLNITGQSGAGTNYQVKLLVGESSGASGEQFDLNSRCTDFPSMKGDSSYDIAFTDNNELTELYAWVESVTGTTPSRLATIWVEVADDLSSGTVTTYCYYGSSTETSSSDGDNTFIFFDDFDSDAWQTGKVGNCIDFGTGDDWVNCGNSTTANLWGAGNLTIDAWVKQTTNEVQDIIFKGDPVDKWGSYTLRSSTDNQSLWCQMDDGVSGKNWGGTSDVIDGTWRHVVVTLAYNGTGFDRAIYIDGVADTQTGASYVATGLFNTTYPLTLGKCTWGGDPAGGACFGYDGLLDELHIYSRVLNATEAAWSYARGNAGLASNVSSTDQIGYWAFDESTGTTATDSSGNGNHGTLNNFAGTLDTAKWDDLSTGGTVVVSGSTVTLSGVAAKNTAIRTDSAVSTTSTAMRAYCKTAHVSSTSYSEFVESHNGGYVSSFACYAADSTYSYKHLTYVSDFQSTAITGWSANTWLILDQIRNSTTNVIFKVDGGNTATHATQVPTTAGKLRLLAGSASSVVTADWVLVRKYVSGEDSFNPTAGSEQSFTVEITNTPASWAIGTIATNAVVYFSATGTQDDDYALITNTGNCAVDIQIQGQNIEGGSYDWVLASAAGNQQYSLYTNSEATPTVYDIEVKSSSYNNLCADLAEDDTYNWSMKFTAPTAFNANDDGNQKSCTVTLVASEAS